MRGLIFDPFAGISGDMVLGALLDAGLEDRWFTEFVKSLELGDISVEIGRVDRRGISCGRVEFRLPHEHAHRHLPDVLRIVERSGASPTVKALAAEVFRTLAEAEARVHGVSIDRVHFHEVGALDAILDVLCAVAGIEELGIERCYSRPVAVGSGYVDIQHGRYPLPAPATLNLLAGFPVRETGYPEECTTPTGAALLSVLTGKRTPPAEYTVVRSAYGAGTRDPKDRPNCLRIILCELEPDADSRLFMVQADIDDMAPEYLASAQDALFAAGALDVVVSPVAMKKGRPGMRLEALVGEAKREAVLAAVFQATSTIGVRVWPVERPALQRAEEVVEWRGQRIRRKRVRLPDGTERSKPEYEDVLRAAHALGLAPFQVRLALESEGVALIDPDN
mgnify:CR=1 FL=1